MKRNNVEKSGPISFLVPNVINEGYDLLESLLWTQHSGYFLLSYHRNRVERSASELGFNLNLSDFDKKLLTTANSCCAESYKIRVRISRSGSINVEKKPICLGIDKPVKVGVSQVTVCSSDPFLCHKTTQRLVYIRAAETRSDCDDVILYNERGEVTESCVANVVIEKKGKCLTPSKECGLLAGTFRGHLLDMGVIEEAKISVDQLAQCDKLYLINSVRKWMTTQWIRM